MGYARVTARSCFSIHLAKSKKSQMKDADSIVFVIDDDTAIRESLESLIRSVGLHAETFPSTREFLKERWSQGVDATLACSLSAGVRNPKVCRGRVLSRQSDLVQLRLRKPGEVGVLWQVLPQ